MLNANVHLSEGSEISAHAGHHADVVNLATGHGEVTLFLMEGALDKLIMALTAYRDSKAQPEAPDATETTWAPTN